MKQGEDFRPGKGSAMWTVLLQMEMIDVWDVGMDWTGIYVEMTVTDWLCLI